jgi:hypothetical protein
VPDLPKSINPQLNMTQTWIRLPPARKGAKCPVSGFSRRKLQTMIYGIPSQGIPGIVKYRHVAGGSGDKGLILIHVPSLLQAMLGEPELPPDTTVALRMLANSPEWCQCAMRQLLALSEDRAGMTATDFFHYLLATNHEPPSLHPTKPSAPGNRIPYPAFLRSATAS